MPVKPRNYASEGIVLARKNYGEADRILSIYSKTSGRISLIAKGSRRPKSRKRGHIEVFNLIRFQAAKGRGIDIMTEAEIIDDFADIRKSLKKISLAYYFSEVTGRMTHEEESNSELFELLIDTLNKLKHTNALKKLRTDFVKNILVILGFWPINLSLPNPDEKLEEVIECQISSMRVGKRMIQ